MQQMLRMNNISIVTFLVLAINLLLLNSTLYEDCIAKNMALVEILLRNSNISKFVYYDSHCYPKIGFGMHKTHKYLYLPITNIPNVFKGTASLNNHYFNVLNAVNHGYRLIDTASQNHHAYNAEEVGRAIKDSGISRDDIYIQTKNDIWNHGYNSTIKDIYNSLDILQVDYIDSYLIHNPYCMSNTFCEGTWRDTWRAMEDVYLLGLNEKNPKIKLIGVSNFNEKMLIELLHFARVKPAIVQNRHDPLFTDWFYYKLLLLSNTLHGHLYYINLLLSFKT